MKRLNQLFAIIIILFIAVIICANIYMVSVGTYEGTRTYRVQINRLKNKIEENGIDSIILDDYSYVHKITVLESIEELNERNFFEGDGSDYVIKYISGNFYRFDYMAELKDGLNTMLLVMNIILNVTFIMVMGIFVFIKYKLISPFHTIKDVPYELSKGNLNIGLKESKSRYFGKFIWGLDMLREKLEKQKEKDCAVQKEKKTLVLSISHDIKTPLSAIKLYSKALIKNLYDSEEKRIRAAQSINKLAEEIEGYVSEIIKASTEDFINLEVNNGEFYLKELIDKINAYYSEKLALIKIEFNIEEYDNCLIRGDFDRSIEALQNIMENAIKYGDGRCIAIRITGEEDCRLVTIANSGCSLSEKELPYMFNSFWRGSNIGNNNGSGLGLYICRQLMLKMHGEIYGKCKHDEMQVTAVFRLL